MAFSDRKPEEIRTWIDEDKIAADLVDYLYERREALKEAVVTSLRSDDQNRSKRYLGAHDEIATLIDLFERKPEMKKK